jgi:hypothetical protein
MVERNYQEGQVWTFRGAPLPQSRVVVGKIDEFAGHYDLVFSVSIINVPIPNTATGEIGIADISHAPVSKSVLDASLLEQVCAGGPSREFVEGYRQWRAAYLAGDAGVFSVEISKVIEFICDVVAKGTPADLKEPMARKH